ncbi:MAG TPA: ATP-binding protein, partial [Bryobacteraceae bacterium]|nr:ATP-binding protein [Bryobacteraceae bacterium]
GSRIRISGVSRTIDDANGTTVRRQMWVHSHRQLQTIEHSKSPSELPTLRSNADAIGLVDGQPVKASGALEEQDGRLLLRPPGAKDPIQVSLAPAVASATASHVEVIGYSDFGGSGFRIRNALVRLPEPQTRDSTPTLTSVAAVRSLSGVVAAKGIPVRFNAIVTYHNPRNYVLFIQDQTGGIYVSCHGGPPAPVQAGDRVELTGVTAAGDFAPIIVRPMFHVLGHGGLPRPASVSLDALTSGVHDSALLSAEGVVRSVQHLEDHSALMLRIPGSTVPVFVLGRSVEELKRFTDARVRITGVLGGVFNTQRQLQGVRLYAASDDQIQVLEPPVAAPPLRRIRDLLQFNPDLAPGHRVRVRGVVTGADNVARLVYVQDAEAGVQVRTESSINIVPGSAVEAIGYITHSGLSAVLESAAVTRLGDGKMPAPQRMAAAEVFEAVPSDRLVELEATVLEQLNSGALATLMLHSGPVKFQAQFPLRVEDAAAFSHGDRVRVRGICRLESDAGSHTLVKDFSLLSLGRSDVTLIAPAPWFADERAIYALSLVTLFGLSAVVWAGLLRKQVREQTEMIRRQLTNEESLKNAAQAASKAKTEFLANMSHEIRTPMNGILGFAALALEGSADEEQKEHLQTVCDSAQLLVSIVDDILDFSKVEAGRMSLESTVFSLHETVRKTVASFGARARDKGLDLVCSIAPDVPTNVEGDPVRLRQILGNLLSNAVKFTPQGSVSCKVSVAKRDGEMADLRIDVVDTGVGIPGESKRRIFEAFTQADYSITRKFGGTGLGLAISARLAELAGGHIMVESEEGQGSTFTLQFPLKISNQTPAPLVTEPIDIEWLSGMQVLVAEDNKVNQRLMQKLLTSRGARVSIAENGLSAVEQFTPDRFDLILMDLQMPDMDGFMAAEHIRRIDRDAVKRTVILALTADVLPETRNACFDAGMDGFLTKPVKLMDLDAEYRRVTQKPVTA